MDPRRRVLGFPMRRKRPAGPGMAVVVDDDDFNGVKNLRSLNYYVDGPQHGRQLHYPSASPPWTTPQKLIERLPIAPEYLLDVTSQKSGKHRKLTQW